MLGLSRLDSNARSLSDSSSPLLRAGAEVSVPPDWGSDSLPSVPGRRPSGPAMVGLGVVTCSLPSWRAWVAPSGASASRTRADLRTRLCAIALRLRSRRPGVWELSGPRALWPRERGGRDRRPSLPLRFRRCLSAWNLVRAAWFESEGDPEGTTCGPPSKRKAAPAGSTRLTRSAILKMERPSRGAPSFTAPPKRCGSPAECRSTISLAFQRGARLARRRT
jgi:hypothetical protein